MGKYNKKTDWNRVERLYRAGLLSIMEISREVGVSEAMIRYYAKKNGWKRDLTQEVRSRTRTKLVENLAQVFDSSEAIDKLKQVTDDQIIEEAAKTQVQVVREHQKTLGQGHSLVMRMLHELDAVTTHRGELVDMIKSTTAPRRQGALIAATTLQSRAAIMRELATSAKLWVSLERQAFNIADDRDKTEDKSLASKTAEQLRQEIINDANRLGLDLSETFGIVPAGTNGSAKTH